MRGLDNAELVRLALEGGLRGQAAWNELVRANSRAVWKAAWSFTMPAADREDVFQCTWMRALERLHQLREPDKIHAWLMTIARHEAEAVVRRKAKLVPVGEPPEAVEYAIDAELIERDERTRIARDALKLLGPECRDLIRLLTVDDLTYHEIEDIMGWAPGGTSIRRSRCLERVRRMPEVARYLRALHEPEGERER